MKIAAYFKALQLLLNRRINLFVHGAPPNAVEIHFFAWVKS
jgi:hypothetical protein